MKPITADNVDGRTLLALRAGPMTPGEVAARVGASVSRWLIKAGYVEDGDCYYRLTDAGRAACPLRNPLAASGVVQPAIYKPETDMSRNNCITRQQVLAAIVEAGAAGTSPKSLIERFACSEQVIYNHILSLDKQKPPVIYKPERGRIVASQFNGVAPPRKVVESAAGKATHATRETVMAWLGNQEEGLKSTVWAIAHGLGCTEESTGAVLSGLYAGLKVDRQKMGEEWAYCIGQPKAEPQPDAPAPVVAAAETPTVSLAEAKTLLAALNLGDPSTFPDAEVVLPGGELGIPSRATVADIASFAAPLQPLVVEDILLDDPADVEFAIFSSGGLDIYCAETTVSLNRAVLGKLRAFLGLFGVAA